MERPMASLTVDFIISLDGYGAAEGWPGYWGMEGPEYLGWIGEDEGQEHVALMGATTYRLMSGFASEMPDDPGLAGLTAATKVVFSSTLEPPLSWANTELIAGDAVEAVRDRKGRESRPMRTVGSLSLCRSLLAAGLVDRFRVVVFPVITGATEDGPYLRRLSRRHPRPGRQSPVRRSPADARVRAKGARRTARRRRLVVLTRGPSPTGQRSRGIAARYEA
jgi:dihydrofolate reductase